MNQPLQMVSAAVVAAGVKPTQRDQNGRQIARKQYPDAETNRDMKAIWLSGICATIAVVLLVAGERTLPLFDGDAARAAKVYKVTFMLLGTGILVGLSPGGARLIANFLRKQIAATADRDGMVGRWRRLLVRYDIPSAYEKAGSAIAIFLGVAGLILAAVVALS